MVAQNFSGRNFHAVAHVSNGKIKNTVSLCGFVSTVVFRHELPDVLVSQTEFLSVVAVFFGPPKVFVDFHHTFSRVLVHFHPLNVNAESVDEESSEVVEEPGLRIAVAEFKGQRKRVRDDALARV